jgi:hypothetical protein
MVHTQLLHLNIRWWTSELGQICPKAVNHKRNFYFNACWATARAITMGSNCLKNCGQSHGLGHWLWLPGSPGQAKAIPRPTLLAWLGLACVAWLGLAFGLEPSHAQHYLHVYEQSIDRLACALGGKAVFPPTFQHTPSHAHQLWLAVEPRLRYCFYFYFTLEEGSEDFCHI